LGTTVGYELGASVGSVGSVLDVVHEMLGALLYCVAQRVLDDIHDMHALVEFVAQVGVDSV